MHLCLFEDGREQQLAPMSLTRPVFELVCGRFSLRERLVRAWEISEWGVILRPYLTGVYREEYPEARINDPDWLFEQPVLLVNGRWIPRSVSTLPCDPKEAVLSDNLPVAVWVLPDEWKLYGHLDQTAFLKRVTSTRTIVETDGTILSRPRDLIRANAQQLGRDYHLTTLYPQPIQRKGLEILGDARNLSVSPRVSIEPFVVLDVREGPITIDDGVKIQSFSRITGPCHIGRETQIQGGRIASGSTIGRQSTLAGDVSNSILQSQVTQLRGGHLEDSYISPWVELGAGSVTRNRIQDHASETEIAAADVIEDDWQGASIGDFVQSSPNTVFDADSAIGPLAMIHSSGSVIPRQIPAFSRYSNGQLDRDWPLENLLQIAQSAMSKQDFELSSAQEMLFRLLFDQQAHPSDDTKQENREQGSSPHTGRSAA